MSSKGYYKGCVVPKCKSSLTNTPNKLFISVPRIKTMRKKWLALARRDPLSYSFKSVIYFCEDHFDLPNDMVNYMEYHVMGSVSQVNMKPGCVPSKFACQQVRRKQTNTTEQTLIVKTQRELKLVNTSVCSDMIQEDNKQMEKSVKAYTLLKINSRSYIGIPKSEFYIVNFIEKVTKIPTKYIILCLKKIRCNSSYTELGDNFATTPSYVGKILLKNIPIIASVMRPFIIKLNTDSIKKHLPIAFRHKYYNVSCIIDCLEIEIQKPLTTLHQSLLWSEYKKGYTIKYIVSYTPNGLVNYISPGFSGRVSNTYLLEASDFIKCAQPGMSVMADKDFKHLQLYLCKHEVQLVQPPKVTISTKLSKSEGSLRIHVESVIRRLREFSMLKPHVCLDLDLVKVLDDVITIACGLINLQDSIIK